MKQADHRSYKHSNYGHAWTKGEILLQFSESPENQVNVIGTIQNGFEYLPFQG